MEACTYDETSAVEACTYDETRRWKHVRMMRLGSGSMYV